MPDLFFKKIGPESADELQIPGQTVESLAPIHPDIAVIRGGVNGDYRKVISAAKALGWFKSQDPNARPEAMSTRPFDASDRDTY